MQLDAEKFQSLKELAEIQQKTAQIRGELAQLYDQREEYLQKREKEATERVIRALEASKQALREAENNHETLVRGVTLANQLIVDITSLQKQLRTHYDHFVKETEEASKLLEVRIQEIEEQKLYLRNQGVRIASEWSGIAVEKERLQKGWQLLEDRKGVVQRQIERLKKGKL